MEAARNAGRSTMQTVEAVGGAANVTATEMPRFNNNMATGINVFDSHAATLNQTGVDAVAQLSNTNEELSRANGTMATGINVFDGHAATLNQTGVDAVAQLSNTNEELSRANGTMATGINVFDGHAATLNQTGVDAVAQLSNTNEELSRANGTMATGINDFNNQVNAANQTGVLAVSQISELNETASSLTNVITDFLTQSPFAAALHLLGPIQYFMIANAAVVLLRNLNIIRPPPPSGLMQLTVTMNNHNDDYLTVETPNIVTRITGDSKSSMIYNKSNNSITLYFFYTRNNIVAEQLRGDNYLAFDSFRDMMAGVFELNAYLATGTTIKKRSSVIYFLDPHPSIHTLSHMEFSGIHQNIRFVNDYRAAPHVTLSSVKVLKDCIATFEHFNIGKIDATNGGKVHLHHCRVNWNLHAPNPFLFVGVPSAFDNPHNVCGTVTYNECHSNVSRSSSSTVLSAGMNTALWSMNNTKTTINITNISDESWWIRFDETVKYDSGYPFEIREIPPLGGNAHFTVTSSRKKIRMYFTDGLGQEHMRTCKATENITIVSPTINFVYRSITNGKEAKSKTEETHSAILVVGRFGSGKSTLLNSLAGTYWTGKDGKQLMPKPVVEKFRASPSPNGCTKAAISEEITTFDGRKLTVIDTIGYDDIIGENVCNSASLTKVMNQHEFVSAIVIVMNSADKRISHGLLESLLCIPKSFNQTINRNVVFVWTNWNEDDEEEFGHQEDRGFTAQLNVIRDALGFDENENIPSFWVDNRKLCPKKHTIDNLTRFLDKVDSMPPLSCKEFQEMRALSLYARIARKAITEYFKPSEEASEVDHSKFEQLLFNCSYSFSEENKKKTYLSPGKFQKDLVSALEQKVPVRLNEEVDKVCKAAFTDVWEARLPKFEDKQKTMGQVVNNVFIVSGLSVMFGLSAVTFGLSLAGLPLLIPSLVYQAKGWSRDEVIQHVVFSMSNHLKEQYCAEYTNKFTSHVDKKVQELQEIFATERERERKRDTEAM